jgi:hypothetical protein
MLLQWNWWSEEEACMAFFSKRRRVDDTDYNATTDSEA